MTIVNLQNDPTLITALSAIIAGAGFISNHDTVLHKKINELKAVLSNPVAVDYNSIITTLSSLTEIVSSYEPSDTTNPQVAALPTEIFRFRNGLEELKTKTDIDGKYFSAAEIEKLVNRFCKFAAGK